MGNLSNLYVSQSFQSLIHLGTNSVATSSLTTLQDGYGNSIGIEVNTAGDLFLSGSLTASLQEGYLYVGGGNGKTTAFATASLVTNINTGSLVTTASFNSYTASTNIRLNNLESTSASVNISISNINSVTSSFVTTASFNAYSQSTNTTINNLSASLTVTDNFLQAQISAIDVSGSAISVASLNVFTGSQLIINSGYNTFTQSANSRLNNLESTSASVNVSITNINSFTQSANVSINALNAATSSYVTSAITASSIITASVTNDDITFTKGDGSQFTIQVATGSFALSSSYAQFAESASYAQFATDIYLNVKNTTGAQLNKGTVVRIIGATGDNALIATASWENDNNSANTLGFLYENIANDSFGKVITQGTLLGINTDPVLGYAAGQILYLSSSGQYTNVKPPAPYHEVRLGQVLRAQQNNGSMYVLIQNGYELEELHDVDINTGSLANNNLLAYNSATSQWENKTLTQVGATTTSSFNSYTSSNDQRVSSLETNSGSVNTSITNINSATASLFTSASLALTTASFDNGTRNLTFTKGDASTFVVNIPDVSGSTINTGSFATTGSNTFVGNQIVNGLVSQTFGAPTTNTQKDLVTITGSNIDGKAYNYVNFGVFDYPSSGDPYKDSFGFEYYDSTGYNFGTELTLNGKRFDVTLTASGSTRAGKISLRDQYNGTTFANLYADDIQIGEFAGGTNTRVGIGHTALPSLELKGQKVSITGSTEVGTFTASLQNGYVWVGNASGRTTTVPTSSFGGGGATFPFTGNAVITGSLLVSGSSATDFTVVGAMTITGSTAGVRTDFSQSQVVVRSGSNATTLINAGNVVASNFDGTQFQQITVENNEGTLQLSVDGNGSYISDYSPTLNDYSRAIKFQPYGNYQQGRVDILRNLNVGGNTTITGSLTQSGSVTIQGNTTFLNRSGDTTNVILGNNAMNNITGNVTSNVAIGAGAMRYASGSTQCVALGANALGITTGSNNFAIGAETLASNTTGNQNVGIGVGALNNNKTGNLNTAIGNDSGFRNVSGSRNVYIGPNAGNDHYGDNTIMVGGYSGGGQVLNNNIILSDGQGNIKAQYSGSAWALQDEIKLNKGSNKPTDIVSVNGSLTVNNSLVTTNSIILVTTQNGSVGGTEYPAVVMNKGAGTFDIIHNYGGSLNVAYLIINPT